MNIKRVRESLGLRLVDMSRLLGIGATSNYQRIEEGKRGPTLQQQQAVRNIQYVARIGKLPELLKEVTARCKC